METLFVEFDSDNRHPINADIQSAIDGFISVGFDDIRRYNKVDIFSGKYDVFAKNHLFVGSIDSMTQLFKNIHKYPEPIDFPKSIIDSGLINREIKFMKLSEFISLFKSIKSPMFVKPVRTKFFDGALISEDSHLNYIKMKDDIDVIVTDKIHILSEFRAYVYEKELIHICNYSGNVKISPDFNYIEKLICLYEGQPIAYTIDVAVLEDRSNTVIEFNDFWAIGNYGMYCINYYNMLHDRYFEIVNK